MTPAAPTPPDDAPARGARRLRLSAGALIAAAAVAPLLVGSALYSERTVRRAAEAVLQSEAESWARALSGRTELRGPATREALQALLDESEKDGLRYLARVGRDGRVEAGAPAAAFSDGELREDTLARAGGRVRYVTHLRPPPGGRPRRPPPGPPPDPPPGPHTGDHGPPPGPPPGPGPFTGDRGPPPGLPPGPRAGERGPLRPLVVLEFEPRLSPRLQTAARRTLALGALSASTIVLLAAWAWQSLRRRAAVEREAARARHLAALGEMSAVLAHEIRNPLASLKGHAQLMTEGLADAPGADAARARAKATRIVDEAVRIERITTDLLDFVRQTELERAPVDLGALVRLSVEEVVPADRLRLSLPAAPLVLAVDGPRLRQVLENLARNALQAGEAGGGPVEIAVAPSGAGAGAGATITVRDHGPGIAAGQAERIFEPFVTTRTRGTGLGLAIARRIVERHGGTVSAGNHPGGGALFRVTLPAAAR